MEAPPFPSPEATSQCVWAGDKWFHVNHITATLGFFLSIPSLYGHPLFEMALWTDWYEVLWQNNCTSERNLLVICATEEHKALWVPCLKWAGTSDEIPFFVCGRGIVLNISHGVKNTFTWTGWTVTSVQSSEAESNFQHDRKKNLFDDVTHLIVPLSYFILVFSPDHITMILLTLHLLYYL